MPYDVWPDERLLLCGRLTWRFLVSPGARELGLSFLCGPERKPQSGEMPGAVSPDCRSAKIPTIYQLAGQTLSAILREQHTFILIHDDARFDRRQIFWDILRNHMASMILHMINPMIDVRWLAGIYVHT